MVATFLLLYTVLEWRILNMTYVHICKEFRWQTLRRSFALGLDKIHSSKMLCPFNHLTSSDECTNLPELVQQQQHRTLGDGEMVQG